MKLFKPTIPTRSSDAILDWTIGILDQNFLQLNLGFKKSLNFRKVVRMLYWPRSTIIYTSHVALYGVDILLLDPIEAFSYRRN